MFRLTFQTGTLDELYDATLAVGLSSQHLNVTSGVSYLRKLRPIRGFGK